MEIKVAAGGRFTTCAVTINLLLAACMLAGTNTTPTLAEESEGDNGRFLLAGNVLVSQDRDLQINIAEDWLDRDAEGQGDFVPTADFDPEVVTFAVTPDVFGAYLSSYGIQQEGSAGGAWGRDIIVAIDATSYRIVGRLPDLVVTKSRARYMGCIQARNDLLFLGDIDEDGATDVAVLSEELRCDEQYDRINRVDSVVASHRWGAMKWYVFDGTGWRYSTDRDDQCTPQPLLRLHWPGLVKGPVDLALEMSRVESVRRAIPAPVSTCVR